MSMLLSRDWGTSQTAILAVKAMIWRTLYTAQIALSCWSKMVQVPKRSTFTVYFRKGRMELSLLATILT
ncbi:hypothetical protein CEE57_10615 [Stenotrophomonas maltophilia]|nr:hypothetical protein CEE57_10615 [Stenotrophomonas maltophilia]